jgi:hypothetical protein
MHALVRQTVEEALARGIVLAIGFATHPGNHPVVANERLEDVMAHCCDRDNGPIAQIRQSPPRGHLKPGATVLS